jgi:DNA-binding transcriptional LysR family regulator
MARFGLSVYLHDHNRINFIDMSEKLLSLNGLSLERRRNFALIADSGGLTKATGGDSNRMALFSRQLKELETYFGVALRRRKGRGIVLTEAGRRLAALAREQVKALEDFHHTCRDLPVDLTIAAGNSVLEWLLLPHCHKLKQALPDVRLRILSERTQDIVDGLLEQSLDFGIFRSDALRPGLKAVKVRSESYSFFVPGRLASGLSEATLREKIGTLPIATSIGGQFREQLETDAAKARWVLNIELSCSSFTQAARAVASEAYAGVLPDIASAQFSGSEVRRFTLPFLKRYLRPLVPAWHPRTEAVRDVLRRAREGLADILHATGR